MDSIATSPDVDPSARPPRPERGQEVEVTVDRLAYGGNGVARLDGYVLFVPGRSPATSSARR